MFHWLQHIKRRIKEKSPSIIYSHEGFLPPSQDTFSAIGELSRVVRNNPDAVEIYLALGNLFRSQGEIERAIQIRTNLIARPHLEPQFKARAWFELGLDYKRAGILDRAQAALEQAHRLTGDDPAVIKEMAGLSADSGNFQKAADYYALLGQPLPRAHYLVKAARQDKEAKDSGQGQELLEKALKVYPGSVEAWLEIICRDCQESDWNSLSRNLKSALENGDKNLGFALLEGLFQFIKKSSDPLAKKYIQQECSKTIVNIVGQMDQDLVLCYYCAIFLRQSGLTAECLDWLEKALVLGPDFWPARLEIMELSQEEQVLTESFKTQLLFFTQKAKSVKRFVCKVCGLKREQVFFLCPRCYSWHSISFRTQLSE